MAIISTGTLSAQQKIAVSLLWNQEYPVQLLLQNVADFDHYLSGLSDLQHLLYTGLNDELLGWAIKFKRNGEKWFAIIVDSHMHKQGIGAMLLQKLREDETVLNGWVVDHDSYKKSNAEAYQSPLPFYIKNGFKAELDIRSESDTLSAVKISWTVA